MARRQALEQDTNNYCLYQLCCAFRYHFDLQADTLCFGEGELYPVTSKAAVTHNGLPPVAAELAKFDVFESYDQIVLVI